MEILIADDRKLPLAESYQTILAALPEEERLRAEKYYRQADRLRCAAGAFLIRQCVKNACGKNARFTIARSEHGKPYVREYPALHFSLSHSGNLIVCAQADCEAGVDAAKISAVRLSDYAEFLSADELLRLRNEKSPDAEFFRIWTVKEAFAKKTGLGLPLYDWAAPAFDYNRGRAALHGQTSYFKSFRLDGHIISICADSEIPDIRPHFITKAEWTQMLAESASSS